MLYIKRKNIRDGLFVKSLSLHEESIFSRLFIHVVYYLYLLSKVLGFIQFFSYLCILKTESGLRG